LNAAPNTRRFLVICTLLIRSFRSSETTPYQGAQFLGSTSMLDGNRVPHINANLRSAADTTKAKLIHENAQISFMGDTKGGGFDISSSVALGMLNTPNPHGRPNSDVLVPWINGRDVTQRTRDMWIIDFGVGLNEESASLFEQPFAHVTKFARPEREKNRRESYRKRWWLHVEPRPALRAAVQPLSRFLVTARVAKHRLFTWITSPTLPDSATFVFAREDDYFGGLVQSSVHHVWALAQATQLRERESGLRYTPTSCFETFPFPEPNDSKRAAIAEAAKQLDTLRTSWLNPPEWTHEETLEFPGSADGPWARYVVNPNSRGIGTVRYPRLVPKDEDAAKALAKRTLTNLYNERPTWLHLAHTKLDAAVFDAYGWPADLSDDDLLGRLLALNLDRSKQIQPTKLDTRK
jgi:hypothetical protein